MRVGARISALSASASAVLTSFLRAPQWQLIKSGILKFPFLFGFGAVQRLLQVMNYTEHTELTYGKGTLSFWCGERRWRCHR